MKNMRMARKLGVGFGSVMLLVCVLGYMAYQALGDSSRSVIKITVEYIPASTMAANILDSLRGARYNMLRYEDTGKKSDYAEAEKHINAMGMEFEQMQRLSAAYPELRVLAKTVQEFPPLYKGYKENAQATDTSLSLAGEMVKTMLVAASTVEKNLKNMEQILYEGQKDFQAQGDISALGRNGDNLYLNGIVAQAFKELRRVYANARLDFDFSVKSQIETVAANAMSTLASLEANAIRSSAREASQRTNAALKTYLESMDRLLKSWEGIHTASAQQMEYSNTLVSLLATLDKAASENAVAFAREATAQSDTSMKVIFGVTLGAVVLSGILSLLITRLVTLPLGLSMRFAQSVAAGNLDDTLSVHSRDEVGKLADALRSMVDALKEKITEANEQAKTAQALGQEARVAMGEAQKAQAAAESARRDGMLTAAQQLEGIVEVVSSASTQLAAQVEESGQGAAMTSARIAEAATAMEEMNAAVLEVARSAGSASQTAADAKEKAEHGAEIVQNVVRCIADVEQQSSQLKVDMLHLGQQAEAIGTIMNVISDIADQTNLLALNAAIEAARAGEAGRGFAVVADEVRKLAEKTMQATVEVDNAIKGVQRSTEKNMQTVDCSSQVIAQATALTQQAGASLKEIVSLVDSSSDQVSTIATAAEEQSSTSEEINRSLGVVSSASSDTAQAMGEAAQAVSDLSQQTHKLARLIDEMKRG